MTDMNFRLVAERLSEPSTWAGLAGLALAFGVGTDEWAVWSAGLAGIFGIAAMILKEKGGPPDVP